MSAALIRHTDGMNGILRIATFATTAALAASILGACGSDDNGSVPEVKTNGTTNVPGTTESSEDRPESAGDRYPDAPDNSISDRPGGPDQPNGGDTGGSGSGGVSPPQPSPAR